MCVAGWNATASEVLTKCRCAAPQRQVRRARAVCALSCAGQGVVSSALPYTCVASRAYEALRVDKPPRELEAMMRVLAAVLEPTEKFQVRSPADVAGMLMVTLG